MYRKRWKQIERTKAAAKRRMERERHRLIARVVRIAAELRALIDGKR